MFAPVKHDKYAPVLNPEDEDRLTGGDWIRLDDFQTGEKFLMGTVAVHNGQRIHWLFLCRLHVDADAHYNFRFAPNGERYTLERFLNEQSKAGTDADTARREYLQLAAPVAFNAYGRLYIRGTNLAVAREWVDVTRGRSWKDVDSCSQLRRMPYYSWRSHAKAKNHFCIDGLVGNAYPVFPTTELNEKFRTEEWDCVLNLASLTGMSSRIADIIRQDLAPSQMASYVAPTAQSVPVAKLTIGVDGWGNRTAVATSTTACVANSGSFEFPTISLDVASAALRGALNMAGMIAEVPVVNLALGEAPETPQVIAPEFTTVVSKSSKRRARQAQAKGTDVVGPAKTNPPAVKPATGVSLPARPKKVFKQKSTAPASQTEMSEVKASLAEMKALLGAKEWRKDPDTYLARASKPSVVPGVVVVGDKTPAVQAKTRRQGEKTSPEPTVITEEPIGTVPQAPRDPLAELAAIANKPGRSRRDVCLARSVIGAVRRFDSAADRLHLFEIYGQDGRRVAQIAKEVGLKAKTSTHSLAHVAADLVEDGIEGDEDSSADCKLGFLVEVYYGQDGASLDADGVVDYMDKYGLEALWWVRQSFPDDQGCESSSTYLVENDIAYCDFYSTTATGTTLSKSWQNPVCRWADTPGNHRGVSWATEWFPTLERGAVTSFFRSGRVLQNSNRLAGKITTVRLFPYEFYYIFAFCQSAGFAQYPWFFQWITTWYGREVEIISPLCQALTQKANLVHGYASSAAADAALREYYGPMYGVVINLVGGPRPFSELISNTVAYVIQQQKAAGGEWKTQARLGSESNIRVPGNVVNPPLVVALARKVWKVCTVVVQLIIGYYAGKYGFEWLINFLLSLGEDAIKPGVIVTAPFVPLSEVMRLVSVKPDGVSGPIIDFVCFMRGMLAGNFTAILRHIARHESCFNGMDNVDMPLDVDMLNMMLDSFVSSVWVAPFLEEAVMTWASGILKPLFVEAMGDMWEDCTCSLAARLLVVCLWEAVHEQTNLIRFGARLMLGAYTDHFTVCWLSHASWNFLAWEASQVVLACTWLEMVKTHVLAFHAAQTVGSWPYARWLSRLRVIAGRCLPTVSVKVVVPTLVKKNVVFTTSWFVRVLSNVMKGFRVACASGTKGLLTWLMGWRKHLRQILMSLWTVNLRSLTQMIFKILRIVFRLGAGTVVRLVLALVKWFPPTLRTFIVRCLHSLVDILGNAQGTVIRYQIRPAMSLSDQATLEAAKWSNETEIPFPFGYHAIRDAVGPGPLSTDMPLICGDLSVLTEQTGHKFKVSGGRLQGYLVSARESAAAAQSPVVYSFNPVGPRLVQPAKSPLNMLLAIEKRLLQPLPSSQDGQRLFWDRLRTGVLGKFRVQDISAEDKIDNWFEHLRGGPNMRRLTEARDRLIDGRLEVWNGEKMEIFVKTDEYLSPKVAANGYSLKPRLIQNVPPEVQVLVGPEIYHATKSLKSYHNPREDPPVLRTRAVRDKDDRWHGSLMFLPERVEDLNQWAKRSVGRRGFSIIATGDDSVVILRAANNRIIVIEGDYEKFDTSQQAGPLMWQLRWMLSIGMDPRVVEIMALTYQSKFAAMMNVAGISPAVKEVLRFLLELANWMRPSGGSDTSFGNSSVNGGGLVGYLDTLSPSDPIWDKSLAEIAEAWTRGIKDGPGFAIKTKVYESLSGSTFLKGMWLETNLGLWWAQLPSRLLKMGQVSGNPVELYKKHPRVMAADKGEKFRVACMVHHASVRSSWKGQLVHPLIAAYFRLYDDVAGYDAARVINVYSWVHGASGDLPETVDWTPMNERYGWSCQDVDEMVAQIKSMEFGDQLVDPRLEALRTVDY